MSSEKLILQQNIFYKYVITFLRHNDIKNRFFRIRKYLK